MKDESKVGRPPIEITQEMIEEAQKLSELGLNEKQISESLGIAYSSFQKHKKYFREALKKGKSKLRVRITSKLLDKIDEGSETSLIFACKRLGLFQSTMVNTKAPKTISDAITQLSEIYVLTTMGEITESQGEKYSNMLEKILKSLETLELESRVKKLEESYDESII